MLRAILIGALLCISAPVLAADDTQPPYHVAAYHPTPYRASPATNAIRWTIRHSGDMLRGVYEPLAHKARQIVAACGSKVISGVRHTRVAGTRRMSLHASGKAVDMRGNPACIYRMLAGWPGGYSVDYRRVNHVHFSLNGREDGLRFVHGRKHKHKRKHRHRH